MITSIIQGALSYLDALVSLRKYNLFTYLFISSICSLLIGALVVYGIWQYYDDIGIWMTQIWVWDWGKEWFTKFAEGLVILVSLFLFFFIYKYLVFILLAPLLSLVSQKMEAQMLGKVSVSGMNIFQEFLRGLRLAIRNIIREIILTIVFIIIGMVLPFLSWAIPIIIFIIQAYYAGFGNMDYTLERYHNTRGSIGYVSDNKGFAIGNGAVFLALLTIPIIGMLIAPFLGAVGSAEVIIRAKQGQVN